MEKNTWSLQYYNNDMRWPNEMIVRMFKGNWKRCNFDKSLYPKQSICDVGCGDCGNFPLYKALNFKRICGVEIEQDIVDLNNKRMAALGIDADVRVGANDKIPFENNSFDYLISWNAGYYMGKPDNYHKFEEYVEEFARVLRGGVFLFSLFR